MPTDGWPRHASVVKVELDAHDAILQLAIRDDGLGGADPSKGSGLARSRSKARPAQWRPSRRGGSIIRHATQLDDPGGQRAR
jgi:hypothetical protein